MIAQTIGAAPARPSGEPAPILRMTRAGIAVLFVLAVANGGFLYLFPSRAATDYAWPIAPPLDAAVLGAGYLAGAIGTGLALLTRRWRSVLAFQPGFILLGAALIAATIVHQDRFRWDYPPTILWTVVYAVLPPAIALLWWRQSRREPEPARRDRRLRPLVAASSVVGGALAALALLLFVAPETMVERWPWQITPLLARAFAGWYALAGGTLLFAAVTARRMQELPIPYITVGAWSALLLPLPALYAESIDAADGALWAWLSLHAVTLGVCAWALAGSLAAIRGERRARSSAPVRTPRSTCRSATPRAPGRRCRRSSR